MDSSAVDMVVQLANWTVTYWLSSMALECGWVGLEFGMALWLSSRKQAREVLSSEVAVNCIVAEVGVVAIVKNLWLLVLVSVTRPLFPALHHLVAVARAAWAQWLQFDSA